MAAFVEVPAGVLKANADADPELLPTINALAFPDADVLPPALEVALVDALTLPA
jgi:hypothetical protein